jgi:hypothetical protein
MSGMRIGSDRGRLGLHPTCLLHEVRGALDPGRIQAARHPAPLAGRAQGRRSCEGRRTGNPLESSVRLRPRCAFEQRRKATSTAGATRHGRGRIFSVPGEPRRCVVAEEGISRRRMLKRIGAGAAVAWSAPVLTSLRVPAFAQSALCPNGCADILCFSEEEFLCGGSSTCICTRTTENDCFCGEGTCSCGSYPACTTSADCLPNEKCGLLCCTQDLRCLPPCGTCRDSRGPKGGRGGDR